MVAENNDKQITLLRWRDALKLEKMIGEVVDVTDGNIEFGKDIEVDGKIKVNSKNDLCDKDGNPLDLGGGGGDVTKAYVDQQDEALQAQINVNTTDIETLEGKVLKVMTLIPSGEYYVRIHLTDEQNTEFNTNPPDIVIVDKTQWNKGTLKFYKTNVNSYSIGYVSGDISDINANIIRAFKLVGQKYFDFRNVTYTGFCHETIKFKDKVDDKNYDSYEINLYENNDSSSLFSSEQTLHQLSSSNKLKLFNTVIYKTSVVGGTQSDTIRLYNSQLYEGDNTYFIKYLAFDTTDNTYKIFNVGGDGHNIVDYSSIYSQIITAKP